MKHNNNQITLWGWLVSSILIVVCISCHLRHIQLDKNYFCGSNSSGKQMLVLYRFLKGDSCHIEGYDYDILVKYYIKKDTLIIYSLYDSIHIPKVKATFETENGTDSIYLDCSKAKVGSSFFGVNLLDSNCNEISSISGLVCKDNPKHMNSAKYIRPVRYIQLFVNDAHSDTLTVNITTPGRLTLDFEYLYYASYPPGLSEKYFIGKNKLKLIK